MPSINLDNLERYDSKARNEAEEEYMPKDSGNWQKTEEAGAVSFYPVGGSSLEGKVKFSFTETPPAEGDKSPSNPSTIARVSSVKVGRIGKNQLLQIESIPNWLGIVVTANADGTYTFNGSFATGSYSARAFTDSSTSFSSAKSSVRLDPSKTYTLSAELISGSVTLADPNGSNPSIVYGYSDTAGGSMLVYLPLTVGKNSQSNIAKVNSSGEFIVRVQQFQSATFTNAVYRFQLEEGSTATDFEAPMLPANANHDISLGSTYYGGEIDLATGLMTVTWAGKVLAGTEGMRSYGTQDVDLRYTLNFTSMGMPIPVGRSGKAVCSHSSTFVDGNSGGIGGFYVRKISNIGYFCLHDKYAAKWSSTEVFNSWLAEQFSAGTPVTFAYEIATPFTVQLDPLTLSALAQTDKCMPRLNTVYTDADTIQIGYMKSPQRTEQELTQAVLEIESDDSD